MPHASIQFVWFFVFSSMVHYRFSITIFIFIYLFIWKKMKDLQITWTNFYSQQNIMFQLGNDTPLSIKWTATCLLQVPKNLAWGKQLAEIDSAGRTLTLLISGLYFITIWTQDYLQKPLLVNTIRHPICRCQLKFYHAKRKPYLYMV